MSNRDRVVNAIRSELLIGPFYKVSTDPTTKVSTTDTLAPITAASVVVNDVRVSMSERNVRTRQTRQIDFDQWDFEAIVSFSQETSLEEFLERVSSPPPLLARQGTLRQVELLFHSANIEHPVQQSAPRGTRASFSVTARLGPK